MREKRSCCVTGLQVFQWEYGVKLEDIAKRRTKTGEKLIIFAGPSVTSTMPFGSLNDVRKEVEYIVDVGMDLSALFFLPSP